jgi:hypothetical protein
VSRPDEEDLRERVGRLSLEQKVRLLTGADFWTLFPEPAVGLRALVVSDGPAGVRGQTWDERDTSANVPSPTALAATWDTARVEATGWHRRPRRGPLICVPAAYRLGRHRVTLGAGALNPVLIGREGRGGTLMVTGSQAAGPAWAWRGCGSGGFW